MADASAVAALRMYERSFLIDGALGFGSAPDFPTPSFATLDGAGRILDAGNGDPIGDGAYVKNDAGTVHAVVGSSGRNNPLQPSATLDHPVMFFGLHTLGSLIIDVDGYTLDAVFIDRSCTGFGDPLCALDAFSIVKTGVGVPALPFAALTATAGLLLGAGRRALGRR